MKSMPRHLSFAAFMTLSWSAIAMQFDPRNKDPNMDSWFELHGSASQHNKLYKFGGPEIAGSCYCFKSININPGSALL